MSSGDGESVSTGYLHSVEAGSCVDGPGIRVVLFMSGCLLRCQFCHNPDTWNRGTGEGKSVDDVIALVARYADFLRGSGGGVTFSGGEPLFQWPFVESVIRRLRSELDLHVAVQTAAFLGDRVSDEGLERVDLWMVDLKSADPERYKLVTSVEQPNMLRFLRRLQDAGKNTWISYVLVPGLTDDEGHIEAMGKLIAPMKNVSRVEIRPFHQLGRDKWARLGLTYTLSATPTPDAALIERVAGQLRSMNLPVVIA
jgi:pyruvate formate lyase activating enzyme